MAEEGYSTGHKSRASTGPKPEIREVAVVATIKKSGTDVFKVRVIQINGREYADVRVHYTDRDGVLRPTAKGITANVDQLREILAALIAAGKRLAGEP